MKETLLGQLAGKLARDRQQPLRVLWRKAMNYLQALALSRFLAALLYGIGERDPLTLAGAIVTLGAVTLVASLVPALAATRLDPMTVLRNE